MVPARFHGRSAVIKAKDMADRLLCNYGLMEHFFKQIWVRLPAQRSQQEIIGPRRRI